jgi:hypothetical protein
LTCADGPSARRGLEEGEQRFPVLGQTGDRLVVLGIVLVGEHIDRCLGRRTGRRGVNLAKVDLHVDLDREGDLVQHVGGLVNPTALVPGARKESISMSLASFARLSSAVIRMCELPEKSPPCIVACARGGAT